MGNTCSSCMGSRRREDYDDDDESRLLFDDPNNLHYGSFGEQQLNGQDDPLEAQREIEALQRVVMRTSDNMVDIFEIAPSPHDNTSATRAATGTTILPTTQYAFAGGQQEARMARYQTLLSKLSSEDLVLHQPKPQAQMLVTPSTGQPPLSVGSTTTVEFVPWGEDDEEDENIELRRGSNLVMTQAGEDSLVGTFADAAAALAR